MFIQQWQVVLILAWVVNGSLLMISYLTACPPDYIFYVSGHCTGDDTGNLAIAPHHKLHEFDLITKQWIDRRSWLLPQVLGAGFVYVPSSHQLGYW
jgi:hypothetical protein